MKNRFYLGFYFIFLIVAETYGDIPQKHGLGHSDRVDLDVQRIAAQEAPHLELAPVQLADIQIEAIRQGLIQAKLEEQEIATLKIAKSIWDALSRFEKGTLTARKFKKKLERRARNISALEEVWYREEAGFKYDADLMLESLMNIRNAIDDGGFQPEELHLVGKCSLFQYKNKLIR